MAPSVLESSEMEDDLSPRHESLGITERDVKDIKRRRIAEILFRPLIAAMSTVGAFALGFALVQTFDEPSSSYPYAISLAGGATSQEIGTGTRRGARKIALISTFAGFAIGSVVGLVLGDSPYKTSTYYGVYSST